MQRISAFLIAALYLATPYTAVAATKPHIITFGKWTGVKVSDPDGQKTVEVKVRAVFVDSRLKEYSTGNPHEVTERLFVVRRAFRVNDSLPQETGNRWQWQSGGWLLVDRVTGRMSQLNLPDFDPFYSVASWYRDYVAYCGLSEDGKKVSAVVAQVGRRKLIFKKTLGESPGSECPSPAWQRNPPRVTFHAENSEQLLFSIHGRVVGVVHETEPAEED